MPGLRQKCLKSSKKAMWHMVKHGENTRHPLLLEMRLEREQKARRRMALQAMVRICNFNLSVSGSHRGLRGREWHPDWSGLVNSSFSLLCVE